MLPGDAIASGRTTLATDWAFLKSDDLDRIVSSTGTAGTSANPLFGSHPSFQARVPAALKTYVDEAKRFNDLTLRISAGDTRGITAEQYLPPALRGALSRAASGSCRRRA